MRSFHLHVTFGAVVVGLAWVGFGTVAHADSPAGRVYLSGQVHRQGAVDLPENGKLTVAQAIILDGGLADFADARQIRILRTKSDGTSQTIHADYVQIMGGNGTPEQAGEAHLNKDVALVAGDIIIVPERLTNPPSK